MRILVFASEEIHVRSAYITMRDHEVTIVNSHEAVFKELLRESTVPDLTEEAARRGIPLPNPKQESWDEEWDEYRSKIAPIVEECRPAAYDVAILPLYMRTGPIRCFSDGNLIGKEMPHGMALALLAARRGARYIGIVMDHDPYSSPLMASLGGTSTLDERFTDHLFKMGSSSNSPKRLYYQIDKAVLGFFPSEYVHCESYANCICGGMNWGWILKSLINRE